MGNLWHFFGLPDPDGNLNPPRRGHPPRRPVQEPVAIENMPEDEVDPPPVLAVPVPSAAQVITTKLKSPPLGWSGPITSDGEPFHDLGVSIQRPAPRPDKALRYIAPDQMKRIPTQAVFSRVIQGDTAIIDLRPLVHMDSHQMACQREIKHMAGKARVSVFALDAEDKLLMIPGVNVVVDMQKHHLGLTPLL